jgi:hypothetical protein
MSATSATSMMYLESRTEWPPFGTSWIDTWAALAAATAQRIKEVVKAFIVTSAGVGGRGKEHASTREQRAPDVPWLRDKQGHQR